MKLFLSFRYTGETAKNLQGFFYPVRDALIARGDEVYLSLDDLDTWGETALPMKEKFARTFRVLADSDVLLVVVRSSDRSEGMLMEVGYALAQNKPIYLAAQSGVQTYVRDVATKVLEFTGQAELLEKLDSFM